MARIIPIPTLPFESIEQLIKPSIEITGNGNLLCYEGFSGRWFRSSESCVRDAVDEFIKFYQEGNYISWNDLYSLLGIAATHFGNKYGYTGDKENRNCEELEFDITRVPKEENFEGIGEEVLVLEPADEWCYPYDYYMEV